MCMSASFGRRSGREVSHQSLDSQTDTGRLVCIRAVTKRTSSIEGSSPSDARATWPLAVRITGGPGSAKAPSPGESGRGPASNTSTFHGKPLFSACSSKASAVRSPEGPPPASSRARSELYKPPCRFVGANQAHTKVTQQFQQEVTGDMIGTHADFSRHQHDAPTITMRKKSGGRPG